MLTRLLFEPDPVEGGGTTPPPVPAPAPVAPPPPPSPEPPAPPAGKIELTAEEFRRFSQHKIDLDRLQAERAEQVRLAAIEAQRLKDEKSVEVANATKAANDKIKALEDILLGKEKAVTINESLDGVEFASPAAAKQFRREAEREVEVVTEADRIVVRAKGSDKTADERIKEMLASEDYAHFLKPTGRGGSGAGGSEHDPAAPKELSFSDRLIEQHKKTFGDGRQGDHFMRFGS